MEIKYRRELNETYMILPEEGECEEFAKRILLENHPKGLMRMSMQQIDGVPEYCFEISRGNSLSHMLKKRQITFEEIRQVILAISEVVEVMESYLLDVEHLILEPEFIYGVPDFSQLLFCCHPAGKRDFFVQLRQLIQYFLNKIDHLDSKSVETAYELFRITGQEYFRFEDLLAVVGREAWDGGEESREEEEPKEAHKETEAELWDFSKPPETEERDSRARRKISGSGILMLVGGFVMVGVGVRQSMQGQTDARFFLAGFLLLASGAFLTLRELRRPLKQAQAPEAEEDVIEEDDDRHEAPPEPKRTEKRPEAAGEVTEFLNGNFRMLTRERVLISQNSLRYETIRMAKMPFVIGKLSGAADYTLKRSTISRIHARVEQQGEDFFLTDCNSTNGTYINGIRLEPNRRYPLKEGDEVELADIKYIFQ